MQEHPPHTNRQGAMPLRLTHAILPYLASKAACDLSKNAWSGLNGFPPEMRAALPQSVARLSDMFQHLVDDPQLAEAVRNETRKRAADLLEGLYRYNVTPFARDVAEPPCVMRIGSARLLDYGGKGVPLLFVPSLINRYYILDLTRKLSFARHLRASGVRVFILDWGSPGEHERHYNCGLYVTEVAVHMAEWMKAQFSRPPVVAGYCMGGLLALALAQIRPDLVCALGLLATPWDFTSTHFPRIAKTNPAALEAYINASGQVPAETFHHFFHCVNPLPFQSKLREFASMAADDPATSEFLAIEHWVNDGVPMASGAARDCLVAWTQHDTPARGKWYVGGQGILPQRIAVPCFAAAPQDDKIVPSQCALPLTRLLARCHVVEPPCGHVGMLVGRRRKAGLWEPFGAWVKSQSS